MAIVKAPPASTLRDQPACYQSTASDFTILFFGQTHCPGVCKSWMEFHLFWCWRGQTTPPTHTLVLPPRPLWLGCWLARSLQRAGGLARAMPTERAGPCDIPEQTFPGNIFAIYTYIYTSDLLGLQPNHGLGIPVIHEGPKRGAMPTCRWLYELCTRGGEEEGGVGET